MVRPVRRRPVKQVERASREVDQVRKYIRGYRDQPETDVDVAVASAIVPGSVTSPTKDAVGGDMSAAAESERHARLIAALAEEQSAASVRRIELGWVEHAICNWLADGIAVDHPALATKLRSAARQLNEQGVAALVEVLEQLEREAEERRVAAVEFDVAAGRAGHAVGWSKALRSGDPILLAVYYRVVLDLSGSFTQTLGIPRIAVTAMLTLLAASFAGASTDAEMRRQIHQVSSKTSS